MKKYFTIFSNAMDRLGENDAVLKCTFCFVVICLATAIAAALGMLFGTTVAKVLAALAAILTSVRSATLYPNLWTVAGPRLDGRVAVREPVAQPARLVKSAQ